MRKFCKRSVSFYVILCSFDIVVLTLRSCQPSEILRCLLVFPEQLQLILPLWIQKELLDGFFFLYRTKLLSSFFMGDKTSLQLVFSGYGLYVATSFVLIQVSYFPLWSVPKGYILLYLVKFSIPIFYMENLRPQDLKYYAHL